MNLPPNRAQFHQFLTILEPFLSWLSDMAGTYKEGSLAVARPGFSSSHCIFSKKSLIRVKFFCILKSAENSASFKTKMGFLEQKLTIWQPFLSLLSVMAGTQKGGGGARFFVFSLHFLQKIPNTGVAEILREILHFSH